MKRAIYGAGRMGRYFYEVLNKKVGIDFFIDAYTQSTELFGKKIFRPKEAPKALVYNSVYAQYKEIEKFLRSNGFEVKGFLETLQEFPEILSLLIKREKCFYVGAKKIPDEKLEKVCKLLKDDKSIKFFKKIIKFKKTFDIKYYPYPNSTYEEQYFPNDIPIIPKRDELRFIDCGAFTGDTIESLSKKVDKKTTVIAFEPDPNNFKILQKNIKNFSNIDIIAIPMGIYSETKMLKFLSNKGGVSRISENGDILVPVTSLDETVYNFKPNYIKMDIEGSEKEAIIGAQNIIKDFTPNLAIAIYHKPEDLWEIPLLIYRLNPNYDFYIRAHMLLGSEIILYCIGC